MKAYIIKIVLEDSDPLIWRRVIMPAGATYRRLHDVIQNVMNFESGYPGNGYHLYEFDLRNENRLVTDNEDANLKRLKLEIRKPTGLKIDDYIERYKEIRYIYDYGDDWRFTVYLEEIVDDYYFGYPTLLDGAETAPPEDVGGISVFYEFLKVYRDPKHPDHKETLSWLEERYFREYDPTWIKVKLKWLAYKKTEWDKIKHENFKVIEDKYLDL